MTDATDMNWYSDEAATFGDRIAAAREARGLTARDLAERLGVAQQTVEHWENDVSEPRANKVQMLSGVLHVSMRWLLTGEGADVDVMADTPAGVAAALEEIRAVRTDLTRAMDRLDAVERALTGAPFATAAE